MPGPPRSYATAMRWTPRLLMLALGALLLVNGLTGGGVGALGISVPALPRWLRIVWVAAGTALLLGVIAAELVRRRRGSTAAAGLPTPADRPAAPGTAAPGPVVVHYRRPDGAYGDWSLYTWDDNRGGHRPWPHGAPFIGRDEYGAFAWCEPSDHRHRLGFLVVGVFGANEVKDVKDDRFIDRPDLAGEVWLRSGDRTLYPSAAAALGCLTVHYRRPDGGYDGWGLHVWGTGLAKGVPTVWARPRPPDGRDDFGAYWRLRLADPAAPVWVIVHRGEEKDPYPDLEIDPGRGAHAYLVAGDPTVYRSAAAARREVVLHYHRPDGDYRGWSLHCWDGPARPTAWQQRLQPAGRDEFGLVFRVPMAPGAPRLHFILCTDEARDRPEDRVLRLDQTGHEVWLLAGQPQPLLPRGDGG